MRILIIISHLQRSEAQLGSDGGMLLTGGRYSRGEHRNRGGKWTERWPLPGLRVRQERSKDAPLRTPRLTGERKSSN